jgi:spoIIIJ-associated protein
MSQAQEPNEEVKDLVTESDSDRQTRLEEEGEIAADYLEELLDIAYLGGDIDLDVDHGRAVVAIVNEEGDSAELRRLVGEDGAVLDALQELTRIAVQTRTGERSRLMLDIDGYRAACRAEIQTIADEVIAEVKAQEEPRSLRPMNAFERKVVHDRVALAGLVSESSGVEPERYVVIRPA